MKLNLISGTKADDIREDYFSIQGNDNIKTMLKAFDKRRDRLASLFVQMSDIIPGVVRSGSLLILSWFYSMVMLQSREDLVKISIV